MRQEEHILRQLRSLLLNQRERFSAYLSVLDKQKDAIEAGDAQTLYTRVELEEQIVSGLAAVARTIGPMRELYTSFVDSVYAADGRDIDTLSSRLDEMKVEALSRLEQNRSLLSHRMAAVRGEIKALRASPYAARHSIYAGDTVPTLLDIQG
jgi:hypothetical protein